jgi:hypothetical protein
MNCVLFFVHRSVLRADREAFRDELSPPRASQERQRQAQVRYSNARKLLLITIFTIIKLGILSSFYAVTSQSIYLFINIAFFIFSNY